MMPPRGEEELDRLRGDGRGGSLRPSGFIGERRVAAGIIAREPLVPGRAADAIGCAELGDGRSLALGILDKLSTERHRGLLLPWHRASWWKR